MPPKLTQYEAEMKIKNYNSEYKLISKYNKSTDEVTLKHFCGNEYKIKSFKSFFEGSNKCPICYPINKDSGKHSTKRITLSEFLKRIKDKWGDEYSYISGYTGMKKKCSIKHNLCGNIFSSTPSLFLGTKKRSCPICSNKRRGRYLHDENYLKKLIDNREDGENYIWLENYSNDNKKKLKIKHLICNNIYLVRPNDFQQGYSCPYCSYIDMESKGSKIIKEYLNNRKISYITEKKFDDMVFKSALRIDFWLEEYNLAIEYDGLQHFKPTYGFEEFKNQRERDRTKDKYLYNNKKSLLRLRNDLSKDEIHLILEELFKNKTLSKETCIKNNISYYNSKENVLINCEKYYDCHH